MPADLDKGTLARRSFLFLPLGLLAGYLVDRWFANRNACVESGVTPAVCGGCPTVSSCELPWRFSSARATEESETEGKAPDAS